MSGTVDQKNDRTALYLYHQTKVLEVKWSLINAAFELVPILGPLVLLVISIAKDRICHRGSYYTRDNLNGRGNTMTRNYPAELVSEDTELTLRYSAARGRLEGLRETLGDSFKREPDLEFFSPLNHTNGKDPTAPAPKVWQPPSAPPAARSEPFGRIPSKQPDYFATSPIVDHIFK